LFKSCGGNEKELDAKIIKNSGIVEMARKIPSVAKHIKYE